MNFDEERMELARRISKHQAPIQVKADPEAARRQLRLLAAQKLLAAINEKDSQLVLTAEDDEMLERFGIERD